MEEIKRLTVDGVVEYSQHDEDDKIGYLDDRMSLLSHENDTRKLAGTYEVVR